MALEYGEAALFPRSWEAEGAHAGAFAPHSGGDGGECNRDACSLLESDVIRDLRKRLSAGILSSPYGHLHYEAYLGEIYRRSDSVLLERRAFLLEAARDYPVTTLLISTTQNHPTVLQHSRTYTLSPLATFVTSVPTSSTMPAPSRPPING